MSIILWSHWDKYNTNCSLFFSPLPLVHTAKHPLKVNHFTEQHRMISKQMPEARKYFSTSISFQVSLSLIDTEGKLT